MNVFRPTEARVATVTRIALSYYVTNGLSAAIGLLLISGCVRGCFGAFAAAVAAIGVIVVVPSDQPAPRRGKSWQLLPSVLVGAPLFCAVRLLHADPLRLGLLLVPASFLAFLGAAWGKRGIPLSVSAMFAMVFSLAVPTRMGVSIHATAGYFVLGAVGFALYATAANSLLNARYRTQLLADTLLSMGSLMRAQAAQFTEAGEPDAANPIGQLMRGQAALADQLQGTRDMLLESPRTARRQQLAGMLVRLLEIRDQLLACELDVDLLSGYAHRGPVLEALRDSLGADAAHMDYLADCLLADRLPLAFENTGARLERLAWESMQVAVPDNVPSPHMLARGLAVRVRNISAEVVNLNGLARGEVEPELAVVRASWQMFISPTGWSWQPVKGLWHWDAPPLRHAIRAALAIGTAYAISLEVPWGTHAYWILLTIVVVLRGSLAQTLERRNSRVAGTLVGSGVAGVLFALHAPLAVLALIAPAAQGVAHAFAVKRYLVTAIAATVLALVQAHMLNADVSPAFEALERIADTFIGVAVAWGFSYVLPAWERKQIPALIARGLEAQARHARLSLELGQLKNVDNRPELQWRLARREAYDSLSALVQATQRCLAEPRAVRPPLEPLGRLLAHSYQLLAQLTAVKTLLLLRRGHLDAVQLTGPLTAATAKIDALLADAASGGVPASAERVSSSEPLALPDPFGPDVTPWLLRRLFQATVLAGQLRDDAQQVTGALDAPRANPAT